MPTTKVRKNSSQNGELIPREIVQFKLLPSSAVTPFWARLVLFSNFSVLAPTPQYFEIEGHEDSYIYTIMSLVIKLLFVLFATNMIIIKRNEDKMKNKNSPWVMVLHSALELGVMRTAICTALLA